MLTMFQPTARPKRVLNIIQALAILRSNMLAKNAGQTAIASKEHARGAAPVCAAASAGQTHRTGAMVPLADQASIPV